MTRVARLEAPGKSEYERVLEIWQSGRQAFLQDGSTVYIQRIRIWHVWSSGPRTCQVSYEHMGWSDNHHTDGSNVVDDYEAEFERFITEATRSIQEAEAVASGDVAETSGNDPATIAHLLSWGLHDEAKMHTSAREKLAFHALLERCVAKQDPEYGTTWAACIEKARELGEDS